MEAQARRDEPDERRLRINHDSGKISIALKICFTLMAADAQPVIHGLHRQLQILRSFYFDYDQATLAGDAEQIEHAAITGCERGNLRIKMARVELRIEFCGIRQHDGFEPAFCCGAIQRVIRVSR